MTASGVVVEVHAPRFVDWGDPLTVTVDATFERPVTVTSATVLSIQRVLVPKRTLQFYGYSKQPFLPGYDEKLVSSCPLPALRGSFPRGVAPTSSVTITAVGAPTSAGVSGRTATSIVEVELRLEDSSTGRARRRGLVRAGPDYPPGDHAVLNTTAAPGPPDVVFHQPGSSGWMYGQFGRPLIGEAVLRAGDHPIGEGRLELHLIRTVAWKERYIRPRWWQEKYSDRIGRGQAPRRAAVDAFAKGESKVARVVDRRAEKAYPLGHVRTPAVDGGRETRLPFSLPSPGGAAQTTDTGELWVSWALHGRWNADKQSIPGGADITMGATWGQHDHVENAPPLIGRVLYRLLHGRLAPEESTG